MSDYASLQTLTVAIDIDGVVAPVTTRELLAQRPAHLAFWPIESYLELDVMFGTFIASAVHDLLVDFDQHPAVRPMWHSSWREYTTEELAPALGVGTAWPQFATQDEYRHPEVWWKLQAVERWLTEHADQPDQHLLWLDDDIADAVGTGEISTKLVQHPRLTMISPDIRHGLTPDHLNTIHDLMRRLS